MKFRTSLSTNIIASLILGIGCGLFFGEACGQLEGFGNAFIRLLQMTILPYIVVSLIMGIGNLTFEHAKLLAKRGLLLVSIFWAMGLLMVLAMPFAFPKWQSGAFFSKSSIAPPPKINYLDLYIPSNVFHSLADNTIPAVVFFSICVGVAMIFVKNKTPLLDNFRSIAEALTKVTHFVVNLTPIGVFALSASAAGTMTIEQFGRLQVYFATYIVASLVMTFLVLPLLVSSLTRFTYREIVSASKDALITGFTTGSLFVVLPVVEKNIKQLFERHQENDEETAHLIDIVTPVYFNFPDTGKLLSLLFILFAAWFAGSPLGFSQYPSFAFTGFITFFGGVDIAIPFLLNNFQLPSDLYQLYIVAGILNGRFSTLLASMDLLAYTFLCTCALTNRLHIRPHRLLISGCFCFFFVIAVIVGTRFALTNTVQKSDADKRRLATMTINNPVKTKVYREIPKIPETYTTNTIPKLDIIQKRKLLRVGYNPDNLPFAYFNMDDKLVGYDVAMANQLARDLNCELELIPYSSSNILQHLENSDFDLIMGGTTMSTDDLLKVDFTDPYMTLTFGLVVKDYRKKDFETTDKIKKMRNLIIAIIKGSYADKLVRSNFPKAQIVEIKNHQDFFTEKVKADALVSSAEKGSAWTLIYPTFSVVIPKPTIIKFYAAYPVVKGQTEFLEYLNRWLAIQKLNGLPDRLYEKWVLGKVPPEDKPPRWSIMRNVLGWGVHKKDDPNH